MCSSVLLIHKNISLTRHKNIITLRYRVDPVNNVKAYLRRAHERNAIESPRSAELLRNDNNYYHRSWRSVTYFSNISSTNVRDINITFVYVLTTQRCVICTIVFHRWYYAKIIVC